MNRNRIARLGALAAVVCMVLVTWTSIGLADGKEREIKESDLPKAALDALRKLAGDAKFTEIEEEVEHGAKFYEAEWNGPHGKMEATVTESGDLVETEEIVSESSVPKAVLAAARKKAGDKTALKIEKKMVVYYEIEFKSGDKHHEITISPAGQIHDHDGDDGDDNHDDND